MQRSYAAFLIIMGLSLQAACIGVTLAPGADQVRLTRNPADMAHCKPVGNVQVPRNPDTNTVAIADAQRHFRDQVVGLGGDTGLVTGGLLDIPSDGIAYQCP